MNNAEQAEIKQKIEGLLSSLKMELESEQADVVELDQARVGRLSRMDALQGQQMALEQQRRKQRKVQALEGALRRIQSGDYGYCFVCGEEIETRRLQFDPAVTRCMDCTEATD
ncbi:MAG: TraR/DksA C4-type zinc finger protein [Idiomarina sp.]